LPNALATVETVVLVLALAAIWFTFARGPASRADLLRAAAACLCVFVAFGKVLSPQFMIWLLPVVPLVRGRRGLWATGLLALAVVLTQTWFPFRYWKLVHEFDPAASWLLLARDLALVALAALLAVPPRRRPPVPELR
jgi:hypothetical protein